MFSLRNAISILPLLFAPLSLAAQELDGFAEPYRQIELAAAEMGTIARISVKEGDKVKSGQLVASLNDEVLVASLKMAQEALAAEGKLKSALAEVKLQASRLEKLQGLRERRHASQTEVDRAATQLKIAQAQHQAVEEELLIKKLECRRIEAQLEQRRIKSPIAGIVTTVAKDQGEFVSPSDPVVVTVVQLDPLLVVFSIPKELAQELKQDSKVPVNFEESQVQGIVEYILTNDRRTKWNDAGQNSRAESSLRVAEWRRLHVGTGNSLGLACHASRKGNHQGGGGGDSTEEAKVDPRIVVRSEFSHAKRRTFPV